MVCDLLLIDARLVKVPMADLLTGIDDTNREVAFNLDLKNLYCLPLVCKAANRLIDQRFWQQLFFRRYGRVLGDGESTGQSSIDYRHLLSLIEWSCQERLILYAMKQKSPSMLRFALKTDCSVVLERADGRSQSLRQSTLYYASQQGTSDLALLLFRETTVDRYHPQNICPYLFNRDDVAFFRRIAPLMDHLSVFIDIAAVRNAIRCVQFIYETEIPRVHQINTALRYAARKGNVDIVDYLVGKGADVGNMDYGAARYVVRNKHLSDKIVKQTLKILLDAGTPVDTCDNDLVRWAAGNGFLESVKLLIEQGADIHASNDAALWRSCIYGHHAVVDYLLSLDGETRTSFCLDSRKKHWSRLSGPIRELLIGASVI